MRVITVMAYGFKGYFVHSLDSATIAQSYGTRKGGGRGRKKKKKKKKKRKESRSSFYSQKQQQQRMRMDMRNNECKCTLVTADSKNTKTSPFLPHGCGNRSHSK